MGRRVLPRVGAAVTILHLDARVGGAVTEVQDGGRRLRVQTEEGESTDFVLRGATSTFTPGAGSGWPRLVFDPD